MLRHNRFIRKIAYPIIKARQRKRAAEVENVKAALLNFSKLATSDTVLRVEEFQGAFSIDPRSTTFFRILVQGEYEPRLTKVCLNYLDPNRDVIDVGANIGFHTVLFGKNIETQRILAIEPIPSVVKRLKSNIELNGIQNKVHLFEGVASDSKGKTEINTISGKEEFSSIGKIVHPSAETEDSKTLSVATSTLDILVASHDLDPGLIKIDAEGAEHLVLKGATETLKKYRPIIVSELSDYLLRKNGSSAQEVMRFIRKLDYEVIDPMRPRSDPSQKEFGDILCIPSELKP